MSARCRLLQPPGLGLEGSPQGVERAPGGGEGQHASTQGDQIDGDDGGWVVLLGVEQGEHGHPQVREQDEGHVGVLAMVPAGEGNDAPESVEQHKRQGGEGRGQEEVVRVPPESDGARANGISQYIHQGECPTDHAEPQPRHCTQSTLVAIHSSLDPQVTWNAVLLIEWSGIRRYDEVKRNAQNRKFGSTFGFSKNKNLVSYVPKIGKSVILLSTMHSTTTIDQETAEQ
ncbi:hypothetical protein LAZ67_15001803 [Cordylochernes scorpioides]|uniref:Uncharacterized protein n=1 Tax=Cordylochernes scorpioides TaxID=51811 RepID=A0ABY6LBM3_9ARAC|nr:hypothetical protein LAZ67_15001803 [Cordylochernes scorpioides]